MSFNGSGVFQVNTVGQPVVSGTVISSSDFNTLIADLAAGLSTAICKDGQTTVTANIPMSGNKITGLGLGTLATDAASVANANSLHTCEFRMSLTPAVPVTTSDVTAATTIYVTNYKGYRIALFDGANWNMRLSAEMSIAVPATTSTMYDLFCYDSGGTPTLEALAWTNDTTRATALVLQNGVLCKSGVLTRRYLGSFRTTTVSGQTEDSFVKRYVWNYNNRVRRPMRVTDASVTWTYSTVAVRQGNGNAANQLDFIIGVSEDAVEARLQATCASSSISTTRVGVTIGLDSTSSAGATGCISSNAAPAVVGTPFALSSTYRGFPGVGRHFLSWQEIGNGVGTNTWYGDSLAAGLGISGLQGDIWG